MINPVLLLQKYFVKRKASRKAPAAYSDGSLNDNWRQKCRVKLKAAELRTSEPSRADLKKIKRRDFLA